MFHTLFGVVEGETGGAGDQTSQDDTAPAKDEAEAKAKAEAEAKAKSDAEKQSVSDAEAKLLREIMEKKNALKAKDTELSQVKEKLAKFDGINLDEITALLKERKDAETKALEQKGDYDRLKAIMAEQHEAELATLKAQNLELQEKLSAKDSSINNLTIGSAFSTSTFIAEDLVLTPTKAQVIYGSHFDYEDGKIVGYDKPKGAKERTMLIDARGEPLSFEQAISKIIDADPDKDKLIRSKQRSGSNSSSIDGKPTKETPKLTGAARIQKALAGN